MAFENLPRGKQTLVDKDGDEIEVHPRGAMGVISTAAIALGEGDAYGASHQFTSVSSSASENIMVRAGDSDIMIQLDVSATVETQAQFHYNPTVDSTGTEISAVNRNITSDNTANASVYHSNTTSALGDTLGRLLIPAAASGPVKIGGGASISAPFIVPANDDVILKATNQSSSSGDIFVNFYWIKLLS